MAADQLNNTLSLTCHLTPGKVISLHHIFCFSELDLLNISASAPQTPSPNAGGRSRGKCSISRRCPRENWEQAAVNMQGGRLLAASCSGQGLRVCGPEGSLGQRAAGWAAVFGMALSSDPVVACAGGPGSLLPCPVRGFPGSRELLRAVGRAAASPFSHF